MVNRIKYFFRKRSNKNDLVYEKIYSKCFKLSEDYTKEQLIKMYGKEKTDFIINNPDEWI